MSPVNIGLRKGRKRRPSNSLEDVNDSVMDDCMAAMVLMSLSCSPKSHFIPDRGIYSMSLKSIDSGVGSGSAASRSTTPSPPTINEEPLTASPITIEINNSSNTNFNNSNQITELTIINRDEGIDMDETIDFIIDDPIQTSAEKSRRTVFKCTWRGCGLRYDTVEAIEKHVRTVHLGRYEDAGEDDNDHEEEFYYAEIEEDMEIDDIISSKDSSCNSSLGPLSPVSSSPESPNSTNYNLSPTLSSASSLLFFAPSPTWSHLDMARPPHEDPEYKKQQKLLLLQNQQVQNHHQQQQQTLSVTQTIINCAQSKPEPERKTVISSPINIPGISFAHRWSSKVRYSSSSPASCNSSCSFSNSYHHHHHHPHLVHHHHQQQQQHHHNNNNNHQNQSQSSSFLASNSSPINFFSPKAPSKVMRLSSNVSSPVNFRSSNNNVTTITGTVNGATNNHNNNNANSNSNSNNVNNNVNNVNNNNTNNTATSIISVTNKAISTNAPINASNNANSNQWTSLLQSSSSSTSSSSTSSTSSSSKGHSISPTRRTRTETRKCRKVYGMENRDSWCTQCKWKKACTRFVD